MPPDYPPPPLHSLQARGLVGNEYPYQQNTTRTSSGQFARSTHFTIGRRLQDLKHPTSVYTACTTQLPGLQTMWDGLSPLHKNSWTAHAKRWQIPRRTAFLKFNLKRIVKALPPVDHPPD